MRSSAAQRETAATKAVPQPIADVANPSRQRPLQAEPPWLAERPVRRHFVGGLAPLGMKGVLGRPASRKGTPQPGWQDRAMMSFLRRSPNAELSVKHLWQDLRIVSDRVPR